MKKVFLFFVLVMGLALASCNSGCNCANCQTEECCAKCETQEAAPTDDTTTSTIDTTATTL